MKVSQSDFVSFFGQTLLVSQSFSKSLSILQTDYGFFLGNTICTLRCVVESLFWTEYDWESMIWLDLSWKRHGQWTTGHNAWQHLRESVKNCIFYDNVITLLDHMLICLWYSQGTCLSKRVWNQIFKKPTKEINLFIR